MSSPERQPKIQTPETKPEDMAYEFLSQAEALAGQPFSLERDTRIAGLYQQIDTLFKLPEREGGELSLAEAEALMGPDFLGPKAIKNTFGVEVATVPSVGFSREELERAKELGQQLILFIDKAADGEPLGIAKMNQFLEGQTSDGKKLLYRSEGEDIESDAWFKKEVFIREPPRAGWRLVSKEILPDSHSKNYLEQTERLVDYVRAEVFAGTRPPEQYGSAITEFDDAKAEIKELLHSDWSGAGERLENLEITRLLRETAPEAVYRLVVNERTNNQRPLPSNYTWTTTRSSGGDFVLVGNFDADGVDVYRFRPGGDGGALGVCLSRSGKAGS